MKHQEKEGAVVHLTVIEKAGIKFRSESWAGALTFLICFPYFALVSLSCSKIFVEPVLGIAIFFAIFVYAGFKLYPWVYRATYGELIRRATQER